MAQLYLMKIREEENIYKWEPKYSVYTETQTVDGETTEVDCIYGCSHAIINSATQITTISRLIPTFSPSAGGLVHSTGPCKETLVLAAFPQRLAGAQIWLQFL